MKVGDMVKVNDASDWHGMYGIIDKMYGETAFVFCIKRPGKLHPVALKQLLRVSFKSKREF
ncbi:MAG TPA: hypothetical protein VEB00_05655 [Clostridia bacterium]|nr:hypothetical protein [Clostridia bacterium]